MKSNNKNTIQENAMDIIAPHTLDIYTTNKPGVLARIAQVFSRRGFNIRSLFVCPSMDDLFSRMTIGISGDAELLDQIVKQIEKLVDVISCTDVTAGSLVEIELMLIKVGFNKSDRVEILNLVESLGGDVEHVQSNELLISLKGTSEKMDLFINVMSDYNVIEIVRTGKVTIEKSS